MINYWHPLSERLISMRYTAKNLMKFLNINRETLRYYETMGLVHPQIDEESHYRYYNDMDVQTIAECRRYRSQDFSIKEIKHLKESSCLSDYLAVIEEKQSYYEKQTIYFQKMAEKNKETLENISFIWAENPFTLEESKDTYLAPAFLDYRNFENESNKYANFEHMLSSEFAFADFSIFMPKETFLSKELSYIGGTSFTADWARFLNLSTDNMIHIKSRKALCAIIVTNDTISIGHETFSHIYEYLKKQHSGICGDILATQIAHLDKAEETCRYFKVWIPIDGT